MKHGTLARQSYPHRRFSYVFIIIIIIIKHVLIKVTISWQRHCRGITQSLTSKKEQAEGLIAGGRRQTIVAAGGLPANVLKFDRKTLLVRAVCRKKFRRGSLK